MAEIRAFRGFRYDLGRIGRLGDVIAPPYDVIDSALQQQLYDSSEYNAIRLELTRDDPDSGVDKYSTAARTLHGWLNDDVLKQDTTRTIYVLEQEFEVEGTTFVRRGFIVRVRLEELGTGRIFPHEQTLAGPKADRLKLFQATGFNLSPVFGLYPDEAGSLFAKIEPLIRNAPSITAVDHLGVVNRLWPVTETGVVSHLVGGMGPKPIYIADGHHRYETGLKYLAEQQAAGNAIEDDSPANFTMMMLVGMSDPGLVILPTHRLLGGLEGVSAAALRSALSPYFGIVGEFGTDAAACWEHVQLEDSQSILGFGIPAEGETPEEWFAVKLTDDAVLAKLAPEKSPEWRALAVSILQKLVIEQIVPRAFGSSPTIGYVHLLKEVTDATTAKTCTIACLVPPASMDHVEFIAGNRETMPPKSTYFYPKLPTGLVFHSLKKD